LMVFLIYAFKKLKENIKPKIDEMVLKFH